MISNDFQRVFKEQGVDILVTPASFHETPSYREYLQNEQVFDERDFFTACVNIAGLPAITVPCQLSKSGMPVGIQFIADWEQENLLVNAVNWFIKNNQEGFPYFEQLF